MITDILYKKIAKLEAELLLAQRQHQWFAAERDKARNERAEAAAALDAFVVRNCP
jgi:hypothetical protein